MVAGFPFFFGNWKNPIKQHSYLFVQNTSKYTIKKYFNNSCRDGEETENLPVFHFRLLFKCLFKQIYTVYLQYK